MAPPTFLSVTFQGGRFAGHTAPVALLSELMVIQDLVLRVARHRFFAANAGRERVPRGFLESAILRLSAVRDNCLTVDLVRSETDQWAGLFEVKLFDEALDSVVDTLNAISQGSPFPTDLPPEIGPKLAKLGSCLGAEEHLLLVSSRSKTRVDLGTRRKLSALVHVPLETFETLEGEVTLFSDDASRAQLRTHTGETVEVVVSSTDRYAVTEALHERPMQRVRVTGRVVGEVKRKMMEVEDLEVLEVERADDIRKLWQRLNKLRQLEKGWLNGEAGDVPTVEACTFARGILARLLVDYAHLPRAAVYPTAEGAVQAEWVNDQWAIDLAFSPDGGRVVADATNLIDDTGLTQSFSADQLGLDDAELLGRWLDALLRVA